MLLSRPRIKISAPFAVALTVVFTISFGSNHDHKQVGPTAIALPSCSLVALLDFVTLLLLQNRGSSKSVVWSHLLRTAETNSGIII